MTEFHRIDCNLISDVRRLGRFVGMRSNNWRRIAESMARVHGTFTVWRCDDTIIVYSLVDGKVRQKSHKPKTWTFHPTYV